MKTKIDICSLLTLFTVFNERVRLALAGWRHAPWWHSWWHSTAHRHAWGHHTHATSHSHHAHARRRHHAPRRHAARDTCSILLWLCLSSNWGGGR